MKTGSAVSKAELKYTPYLAQMGLTCVSVYQRNESAYYNRNVKPSSLALKLLAERTVTFLLASRYGRMTQQLPYQPIGPAMLVG